MSPPLYRGMLMSSSIRSGQGAVVSASERSKNLTAFSPSSAMCTCASMPDFLSARWIRKTSDLLSSAIRICQGRRACVLSDGEREAEL
jgi:hypothetical protein